MPFKSPFPSVDIPVADLATWLFNSPDAPLSSDPVYIDTVDPSKHLSRHQYRSYVKRLAKGLQTKLKIKPQDKLLVYSGNNIFFAPLLMGMVAAECVFTGANPTFTARELAYQMKDAQVSYAFIYPEGLKTALEAAEIAKMDKSRIYIFDDDVVKNSKREEWKKCKIGGHWTDLLSDDEDFEWKVFRTIEEMHATAAINYSSGTTGMPKGIEISHYNFISNTMQTMSIDSGNRDYVPRLLAAIPMYHAYGMTYFVLQAPKQDGRKVFIMPKFDFVEYLKAIEKYKITTVSGVPPIIVGFAKHPAVDKIDLSSLRAVGCGAAPLSADVENAAMKKLGLSYISQGYGLSEVTCSVIIQPEPNPEPVPGSVGYITANGEGMVVDKNGKELGRNEKGEFWYRGPNVMKGYYNRPKETADTITKDGWLKTGDIAYIDDRDRWFIVDRKKELIKTSGYQVAPAELEAVLLDHPDIADAGVIGVKFAENERPRAYLVKNPGSKVTTEDVLKYMSKTVAKYKQLTGGVVWVDVIPKNPSGKILRKILREMAAKEVKDTGNHRAKL